MLLAIIILSGIFHHIQVQCDGGVRKVVNPFLAAAYRSKASSPEFCDGMTLEECAKQKPEEIKSCQICGVINAKQLSPTIVNGNTVEPPNLYPWMVAILVQEKKHCGAAILNEQYILTAAHCLERLDSMSGGNLKTGSSLSKYFEPNEIKIGFLTDTYDLTDGLEVEEIIPHPGYNTQSMLHDIAVIKLKDTITCDKNKNPICLPSADFDISIGTIVAITGWGATDPVANDSPKELQEGRVELTDFSPCDNYVSSDLADTGYCMTAVNNVRPCFGDSGGSMFLNDNGKVVTVGVASLHTSGSCSEDKPFLYTAVPKYVDWISEVTGL